LGLQLEGEFDANALCGRFETGGHSHAYVIEVIESKINELLHVPRGHHPLLVSYHTKQYIFDTLASMTLEEFEKIVAEEFERAIPEKFRPHIKNVAFLVEDEPSAEVRRIEGLREGETLLGYYHGVPMPERGDWYGMGTTMPDTITLYHVPHLKEAEDMVRSSVLQNTAISFEEAIRKAVRETIWHEVAHHFGMDEHEVRGREDDGSRSYEA
jgi:predicted Zn-dependent protease with MMP-like domain